MTFYISGITPKRLWGRKPQKESEASLRGNYLEIPIYFNQGIDLKHHIRDSTLILRDIPQLRDIGVSGYWASRLEFRAEGPGVWASGYRD